MKTKDLIKKLKGLSMENQIKTAIFAAYTAKAAAAEAVAAAVAAVAAVAADAAADAVAAVAAPDAAYTVRMAVKAGAKKKTIASYIERLGRKEK